MALRCVSPVVWYSSAEDFDLIRAASLDADELPPTYAGWLTLAECALGQMLARGLTAFRAEMRAAEALSHLDQAAALRPADDLRQLRGSVLLLAGRFADALAAYHATV